MVQFNLSSEEDRIRLYNLLKNQEGLDYFDTKTLYTFLCPIIMFVCCISIICNAVLIYISKQTKVTKSPIYLLSSNLAVTDLVASVLNGFNILVNSYLPTLFGREYQLSTCSMLIFEAFRSAALVASALHLLALAFVHYKGIVNPLHYRSTIFFSQHVTRTVNIISIICWLFPLTIMLIWFSSEPGSGFQADGCDVLFLYKFGYRYMLLTLFALPLLLMSVIYLRIYVIISRHQRSRRINHERSTLTRGVISVTGPIMTGAAAASLSELMAQSVAGCQVKCPACEARDLTGEEDPSNPIASTEKLDDNNNEPGKSNIIVTRVSNDNNMTKTEAKNSEQRQLVNRPARSVSNWSQSSISPDSYTYQTTTQSKSRPGDSNETTTTKDSSSDTRSPSPSSLSNFSDNDDDVNEQGDLVSSIDFDLQDRKNKSSLRIVDSRRQVNRVNDCDHGEEHGSSATQKATSGEELTPLMRTDNQDHDHQSNVGGRNGLRHLVPDPPKHQQQTGSRITSGPKGKATCSAVKTVSLVEAGGGKMFGNVRNNHQLEAVGARTGSCRDAHGPRRAKTILRAQFSLGGGIGGRGDGGRSLASTTGSQKEVRLLTLPAASCDNRTTNNRGARKSALAASKSTAGDLAKQQAPSLADATTSTKTGRPATSNLAAASKPSDCTCDNKLSDLTRKQVGGGVGVKLLSRSHTIAADNGPGGRLAPSFGSGIRAKAATLLTMSTKSQGSSISSSAIVGNGSAGSVDVNGGGGDGDETATASRGGLSCSLKSSPAANIRSLERAGDSTLTSSSQAVDLAGAAAPAKRQGWRHKRLSDQRSNFLAGGDHSVSSSTYEPQRRHIHASAVPQTNTKALITTLIILGTYLLTYVPAISYQVLTCVDHCKFPYYTLTYPQRTVLNALIYLLLIAKSIIDPFIYSCRMSEIQVAINRYLSKRRSKTSSMGTSLHTSMRFTIGEGTRNQSLYQNNNNNNNHLSASVSLANNHQQQTNDRHQRASHRHHRHNQTHGQGQSAKHDLKTNNSNTSSQVGDSFKILNTTSSNSKQAFPNLADNHGSKLVVSYSYKDTPETKSDKIVVVDSGNGGRGATGPAEANKTAVYVTDTETHNAAPTEAIDQLSMNQRHQRKQEDQPNDPSHPGTGDSINNGIGNAIVGGGGGGGVVQEQCENGVKATPKRSLPCNGNNKTPGESYELNEMIESLAPDTAPKTHMAQQQSPGGQTFVSTVNLIP